MTANTSTVTSSKPEMDTDARELLLWIENTESLYRQQLAIRKNMKRHILAGNYEPVAARRGWLHLANAGSKDYEREFGFRFSARARVAVAWHLEQQEIAGMVESKENNEPCDKCPNVDNGYTGPGISFFGIDPKTGGTTMTYCTCETGKLRRAYWDIMSNRA